MDKEVKDLLKETIVEENLRMQDKDADSDELKLHSQNFKDLLRIQQDSERLEFEKKEAKHKRKREAESEEHAAKESRKERIFDGIKTGMLIGANILLSAKVMKFEETGTIRSKAWPGNIKLPTVRFKK